MTSSSRRTKMHINLFFHGGLGHHESAWRLAGSDPTDLLSFEHHRRAAETAERAKFDSVFFSDQASIGDGVRYNHPTSLEPTSMLAALAAVTDRIGLIATASTTYNEPFNLARRFATLDHISHGRIGWNIVTSIFEVDARNFGLDAAPLHADRYRRAEEFLDVSIDLWDSWEDEAFLADKESGVLVETERLHALDHQGEFFRVAGPLAVPRSPQGRPVLVQAGTSDTGRDFAARYAEAIFTAQRTLQDGQAFYQDIRTRVADAGRDPDHVAILPGICPFVGSTEEEARRVEQELAEMVETDFALKQLSHLVENEITEDQLDQKFPKLSGEDNVNGNKSRYTLVAEMAEREDLTVRQVLGRMAGGRGHRTMVGTPEQIADDLELWFREGAADGFNLMPPVIPDQLDAFVDGVVPILRERGLFRDEYEGTTLREHLGLERPVNGFTERAETAVG
jgi:FMN-dependent oxidoreductase (nitrilotriacetate monooxygenase family)